jgi:hypothetical protein
MPYPLIEHEALASELAGIELVVYDVMFAEIKKDVPDSALSSISGRGVLDSVMTLGSKDVTGFVFTASDIVAHLLLTELEGNSNVSILTRPRILCNIGTPAHIITSNKAPKYEIELHPVRLEDGRILTKIVVKRTEMRNSKDETFQSEMLVGLLDINRPSLFMGGKLGDKEVVLFVRVAVAVTQSTCDPQ